MSALDDLFQPVLKPAPTPVTTPVQQAGTGITKRVDSILVEILQTEPRSTYMRVATDVMDVVAIGHAVSGKLLDVRQESQPPRGALDLAAITARFYDGSEELWISRPGHMPADLIRFRGRFGYKKSCRMPRDHGSFNYLYWSFLDTNAGELPGIDLGVILVPIKDRWYRVFANKTDATIYYQS